MTDIIKSKNIVVNLQSFTKEELFDELVDLLAEKETLPNKTQVKETLWAREKMLTTGIVPYVAMPHTQIKDLGKTVGLFGISRKGIEYGSLDGRPVHLFMLFIDDEMDTVSHLQVIRAAAVLAKNPRFYPKVMACKTAIKVYHTIQNFEDLEKL